MDEKCTVQSFLGGGPQGAGIQIADKSVSGLVCSSAYLHRFLHATSECPGGVFLLSTGIREWELAISALQLPTPVPSL